jgi:ABC-type transport system involved in cytochrome c biogenesis permease component
LFPVDSKPIVTWGISFLTLGFCKICFSLISGLSALAIVLAGPNNVDMLVTAVVLGLLAPALAISVASGSGLATLSSITQSGQGFGLNSGVGFYNLGGGNGSPNSPNNGGNGKYDNK